MSNENERGEIGKILAQGQNVEDLSFVEQEDARNEGEVASEESVALEINPEKEISKEKDDIYLGELMEGIELTGLTGVTMEDVGKNPEQFQDLGSIPETEQARALKAERNQKFMESMQERGHSDEDSE